ncbi:MAG: 4-hydroxy-tetrahydrodipicolinate reductase [Armatimonadetes bacterium]|nr:4-hydroxy-tetrahydrodipicolinate reductase [Armatimonadota bacterium]
MIKVAISGAGGRMGREAVRAVAGAEDMELVLCADPFYAGQSVHDLCGGGPEGLIVAASIEETLQPGQADVLVDLSVTASAVPNAIHAMNCGAAPVIGTTGISSDGLQTLRETSDRTGIPAMVIPNFSIGAVLMMKFAEEAARWLPDAEIIELHHNKKADAPSGTAMLTADRIAAARNASPAADPTKTEKVAGARGGKHHEIAMHSVRLPGLLAHQMVLFGGQGEVLTIKHDSMDRSSFMPGVLLAVRGVRGLSGLTVGLDVLLFG